MNSYQVGGTSQGNIIPIKLHLTSLIFGIIFPLVCFGLPNKHSYDISKPKCLYIKQVILYKHEFSAYNT